MPKGATVKFEFIKCGKLTCRRCNGKDEYDEFHGELHGPYVMAYWRDKKKHGKLKIKYIGKNDPRSPYLMELAKKILKDEYCLALSKMYP